MALRIKSRWHDDESERSIDEIASALAFIGWRLAKDKAINLHGEDFVYDSDEQRMAVISEYLVFQLQLIDRIAHQRLELDDEARKALVIETAKAMSKHLQDNHFDLFGPGDYVAPFIQLINERAGEYAEFNLTDEGPSYSFLRYLGFEIQQVMGQSQENRWVIDQVMDKDGWDVYNQIVRSIDNLFG